jgi:hypothetical protein
MVAGGAVVLSSCNTNKSQNNGGKESGPSNCNDLSGVSKSEIQKREQYGYVKESTVPGSHCGNCKLYIPPDDKNKFGGCLLFDGPVCPTGFCTQYNAKG